MLRLASSSCKSLQHLISTLTRGLKLATYLAHLLSCAVERERRCQQTPLACVGSAHSGWATQPPQGSVHFLSQSHSGSWLLCEGTVPGGPCVSSGQRVSDSNTPGRYELSRSQEHVVSDWQTAHSLVGTCSLWSRDCSGPLPIASPASLPPRSANPLLCEHATGHSVALEPSREKGLLFFSVSLLFPQLVLQCHISPLRVSSGIQPMLTLRAEEAAAPLHPAPSHYRWT